MLDELGHREEPTVGCGRDGDGGNRSKAPSQGNRRVTRLQRRGLLAKTLEEVMAVRGLAEGLECVSFIDLRNRLTPLLSKKSELEA